MRGVVTLAAALTLPLEREVPSAGYPRELFVFVAFAIIVLTLLVQGTTLPWLARRLGVREDTSAEDALAEAGVQHAASRAALRGARGERRRRAGLGGRPAAGDRRQPRPTSPGNGWAARSRRPRRRRTVGCGAR